MNIAFRVDSSNIIGAGHIRRSLKLAKDLKYRCKKIIFITKNLDGNFSNLIKKENFKLTFIRNVKSKKKLKHDLEATKHICKKYEINTLIIDHYFLGLTWEKEIRKHIDRLVVIDDFSKKRHYCDLIVNNLSKKNLNKTKHLTGLKYIIIPNDCTKKKNKLEVKKISKTLTVGTFFGSSDKVNCSERLLKIFAQDEFKKLKFISILGKNNKNKKRIEKNFKKYKNINIKKKFINMKYFFKKIDIMITVGGVTLFEALCRNIECICIPINYYQKMSCDYLRKNKISNVFNYDEVFNKNGKKLLINCLKGISKKNIFLRKKKYLDDQGSKRIADYISSLKP